MLYCTALYTSTVYFFAASTNDRSPELLVTTHDIIVLRIYVDHDRDHQTLPLTQAFDCEQHYSSAVLRLLLLASSPYPCLPAARILLGTAGVVKEQRTIHFEGKVFGLLTALPQCLY